MGDRASTAVGPAQGKQGKRERTRLIRGIGTLYKLVGSELHKVIWPTRKELVTYTTVVVVFVLIMVTIVAIFDLAFGKGVLAVFGA